MLDAVKVKNDCVQWIQDWFDANGPDCKAVIGISGGKDSSVVAALCVEALGKDRVIGVLMPEGRQVDIGDSYALIQHLDIHYVEMNIDRIVEGFYSSLEDNNIMDHNLKQIDFNSSIQAVINLPPRIRMSMLYFVSQSIGGRVIGTDNASEAYIGYSTRWGDNVADAMPILNLTSDEVIAVGEALGLPRYLTHKTPSDGLCGKSDEDAFGFTYKQLNDYINNGTCGNVEIDKAINIKHINSQFKREAIPAFSPML